ncbi:MAG: IS1634 family transposase [Bacteroidetes bacterium]|nr:IS1634 family transposase [Bacteroidota bacterium]
MEIAGEEIKTYAMDHHGLVAGVCKDIGIAAKIDRRINKRDPRRIVSTGTAAVAMILNGLGFTNRRLYLTPQFFESKPVERLLEGSLSAHHLDDNALGKALDEIYNYGTSRLFGEIAFEIALEHNLLGTLAHIDSTSMSVEGEYEKGTEENAITLTYGHSKDHRPDLKQAVMSLVVSGNGAIPLWMEPQDGNSSDKKTFHETIEKVRAFQKQLKGCPEFKWVADAALYDKGTLLKQSDYLWLSRVPETIKEARDLIEKDDQAIDWREREKGYKTAIFYSNYGDVKQRWLLVYSAQSYNREKKTFDKKLEKQDASLKKLLWHLGNETCACESDATKEINKITKKFPYHCIRTNIIPVLKHGKSGRPKKGSKGEIIGYKVQSEMSHNMSAIEIFLNRKGRFILATNDLDESAFPDENILKDYKEQQNVEKGFRFLKDPWFMVDSVFLKSPHRIEALMMIMTLCLMVYNIGQHRLRSTLKEKNETLPNQINKAIQNPTMRWIFQIMEGIGVVRFYKGQVHKPIKEMITNLSELRRKIIRLFGGAALQIYGIS